MTVWSTGFPVSTAKYTLRKQGSMQERIKEHDEDIQLACAQASAISEESHVTSHYSIWRISFLIKTLLWYICKVKEAIQIRLQPNNITRDSGIEIPEGWTPTIKNTATVQQCNAEETTKCPDDGDIKIHQTQPNLLMIRPPHHL